MKRPSRAATEVATMEHRELVVRAQAGDGDAFAALASAVVDRCYALAYRVLRDPDRAKDATQQALLGVWRDLPTLRELDRFDAWLHRLVVNACYAESRSNHRRQMRFRLLAVPPSDQRDLASSVADRGRNVELEHGGTHDDWSAVDGSGLIKHNDQPGEVDWALSNPIAVYSDACAPGATLAAIGSSVNDLATALLDQTGSKANGPADVTLDGYPAKRIDIGIPEDLDTRTCRISGLQIWAQGGGFLAFPDGWSVSAYVVNVDGGRLVITAGKGPDASAADIAERDEMITSLQINP